MTIPAGPRHVRAVRLVAASLATDLGFDWEQIADLKVAVDELCSLFRSDDASSIELTFSPADDQLEISGRFVGEGDVAEPDWLVREILEATTLECDLPTSTSRRFRLVCGLENDTGDPGG